VRRSCRGSLSNPPLGVAFTAVLYECKLTSIWEKTVTFKFRAVNVLQKKNSSADFYVSKQLRFRSKSCECNEGLL